MAVLVIGGLATMVRRSWAELQSSPVRLSEIRWGWLFAAAACYGCGLGTAAVFWQRVLRALGIEVPAGLAYSAFFWSQLGKYLPGKGMVIVLRVAAIREPGMSIPAAVLSVFVETLTWMAVGAALGGCALVASGQPPGWIAFVAAGLAVVSLLVVSPPCLQFVLGRLRRSDRVAGELAAPRLGWSTLLQGWVLLGLGWLGVAGSLWLVVAAFPGVRWSLDDLPLMVACATLSVVLGFASLLPGGLGVRELVITPLLAGPFGASLALTAAVLVRLVWMGTELLLAAIMKLYFLRRRQQEIQAGVAAGDPHASPTAVDANLSDHSGFQRASELGSAA